jgi:hypothetical protein
MATLKKIGVLSAAKIGAVVDAILGLIIAVIIFIFANLYAPAFTTITNMSVFGRGIVIVIALPIFLLIFGFIALAIETWIYNVIAGRFGGIKFELKKNQLKSIDVMSASKLVAVGGAIIGCLVGLFVLLIGLASAHLGVALLGLAGLVLFAVLFAVIAFIATAVTVIIYNFIASKTGGVMLYFKGNKLTGVGVMSYAKIEGVISAVWGLIEGIIYAIRSALGLTTVSTMMLSEVGQMLGVFSIIVFPIIYFVFGFVAAAIQIALYNWLVPIVGAVELTIS